MPGKQCREGVGKAGSAMRWWERQINTLNENKQERTERKADMESTLFINGNIILQDGILEQGEIAGDWGQNPGNPAR